MGKRKWSHVLGQRMITSKFSMISDFNRCQLALQKGFFSWAGKHVCTQSVFINGTILFKWHIPLLICFWPVTYWGRFLLNGRLWPLSEACGFLYRISPGLGRRRRRSRLTRCQAARTSLGQAAPPSYGPLPPGLSRPGPWCQLPQRWVFRNPWGKSWEQRDPGGKNMVEKTDQLMLLG